MAEGLVSQEKQELKCGCQRLLLKAIPIFFKGQSFSSQVHCKYHSPKKTPQLYFINFLPKSSDRNNRLSSFCNGKTIPYLHNIQYLELKKKNKKTYLRTDLNCK